MRQRFLPSGRVQWFPSSEVDADGVITSLLSGDRVGVTARRFVDATHSTMRVPSTTPPSYAVSSDVACVPLNELPRVAHALRRVRRDRRRQDRDGRVHLAARQRRRARADPLDHAARLLGAASQQLPAHGRGVRPVLSEHRRSGRGRRAGRFRRRRVRATGGVRRTRPHRSDGHARGVPLRHPERRRDRGTSSDRAASCVWVESPRSSRTESTLEQGSIPTGPTVLHVDCSAVGIPTLPSTTVFAGDRITLQWVRTCQPTFSAALIGIVEARFDDDDVKNRICTPIVPPTVPRDWLRMFQVELANRAELNAHPEIGEWLATARLDPFTAKIAQPARRGCRGHRAHHPIPDQHRRGQRQARHAAGRAGRAMIV